MDQPTCEICLRIIEKTQLNHNTFSMRLEPSDKFLQMEVCSFVQIFDDRGNSRPYTPLVFGKNGMLFAIKAYPDGMVSKFLQSRQAGDVLCVSGPFCKRRNVFNEFKTVLMIAGGTGVTPMYQLLRHSILSGVNTTDYTLLFLNKTDKDIFLQEDLEHLRSKSDGRLHITYVLSEGTNTNKHYINGLLTKDLLLKIVNNKVFEFVYICGPPSLYDSFSGQKTPSKEQGRLSGILKEIGYIENNVYKF